MNGSPLTRRFYARNTLRVAREILGKHLVRRIRNAELAGRIVEVEAYRGSDDPASHAYGGRTPRNEVMFGRSGCAYIYFIYGNHYCLNVTTEREGVPGAVLVRALEPVSGIHLMVRNRGESVSLRDLTNGPGKLTQAMKIDGSLNGLDLTHVGPLYLREPRHSERIKVVATQRIGIRAGRDKLWRFIIRNNPFVSR